MSRETMGSVLAKLRLQRPFQGGGIDWIVTFLSPTTSTEEQAGTHQVLVDNGRVIILAQPSIDNNPPPHDWLTSVDVTGMSANEKFAAWAARSAFSDLHSRFTEKMPFENLKLLLEHNFPPGSRLTRTEIYYRSLITKATSHLDTFFQPGNYHFEDYFKFQMCVVGAAVKGGFPAPTVMRDFPRMMRNIALRLCQSHIRSHIVSPPTYVPLESLENLLNRGFEYSIDEVDAYDSDGIYFNIDNDKPDICVNDPAYDHVDEFPLELLSQGLCDSIRKRDYLKRGGRYHGASMDTPRTGGPGSLLQPRYGFDGQREETARSALLLLTHDGSTWTAPTSPIPAAANWDDSDGRGDGLMTDERSTASSTEFVQDDRDDSSEAGTGGEVEDEGRGTYNEDDMNDDPAEVIPGYFDIPRNYLYWFGRGVCPVTGIFFSWRIRYLVEERDTYNSDHLAVI
jgi:hypothetical protein